MATLIITSPSDFVLERDGEAMFPVAGQAPVTLNLADGGSLDLGLGVRARSGTRDLPAEVETVRRERDDERARRARAEARAAEREAAEAAERGRREAAERERDELRRRVEALEAAPGDPPARARG